MFYSSDLIYFILIAVGITVWVLNDMGVFGYDEDEEEE